MKRKPPPNAQPYRRWRIALPLLLLCHEAHAQDYGASVGSDDAPADEGKRPLSAASIRKKRNALTFGGSVGGIWGGAYAAERNLTDELGLQVVYEDEHAEPVDFSIWSGGLFVAYEYGPEDLRLQATLLARFDTQSYSAGAEGYEPLSGSGMVSTRYALLIGPAVTLTRGRAGSIDAGLGVGGVLGYYEPLAGVIDSVVTVAGAASVKRPGSEGLSGLGARAWLSATLWGKERSFGLGLGVYYDVDWLHAHLPRPFPTIWVDQAFGVMVPLSTRF